MIKINLIKSDYGLIFNISGDIDCNYINAMRRCMLSTINIRSFTKINIKKNSSVFDSGILHDRISQFPININDDSINNDYVHSSDEMIDKVESEKNPDFENDNDNEDEIDDNDNKPINSSSLNQLTMYLKYSNKNNTEIVNVTTDNCLFYYGEKKIESPYKNPILIVKLHPMKEIELTAISAINNNNTSAVYSALGIIGYDKINDKEFIINLRSNGQIPEKQILLITIKNIKKMLDYFLTLIIDNKELKESLNIIQGEFTIINSDNKIDDLRSLGSLIVCELHNHSNIQMALYGLPNPMSNEIFFKYKLNEKTKTNIIIIIQDVIKKNHKILDSISLEINKKL